MIKTWVAVLMLMVMPAVAAEHVLVIGVDGLSPEGLKRAATPNIDRLIRAGSVTWTARAVMPTSSSSNWASMIMGAGPEQHGITSNDWQPDKFAIPPTVKGPGGLFPTMFLLLRQQRPEARIAAYYDWDGLGRLMEPGIAQVQKHVKGPEAAARATAAWIREHRPHLCFLQLDHVDGAGHKSGWISPEYDRAVELTDRLVGELMAALEAAGIREKTAVLITSDHGGLEKKHGGDTLAEIQIPLVFSGEGIRAGRVIEGPVNVYDVAPTVVELLGLKAHPGWIGRPVAEALQR
jgi:predicted AlkP superfamily pyrophosphatase or phosphodiesterase